MGVNINGKDFIPKLNDFSFQIDKMNALYDEIIEKARNMQNNWKGNDSDEKKLLIDSFVKTLDEKRSQYAKDIRFLKTTIELYTKHDNDTKDTTDSESFSINGS